MWWELALNPRVVTAYYSSPPELRGVEIHSISLHRDGATLELLAELPGLPDRPSSRWPIGANTAQAGLRFFGLREVTLSGWGTTNVGDLRIESGQGAIRFQFDCASARLAGVAGFFDVTGITGYIKGHSEPGAAADRGGTEPFSQI
jgi:hypothetical protein